jgi:hypothetical protein
VYYTARVKTNLKRYRLLKFLSLEAVPDRIARLRQRGEERDSDFEQVLATFYLNEENRSDVLYVPLGKIR